VRRLKIAIFVLLGLGLLVGLVFFLIGALRPRAAGLFIETVPTAEVYLDNEQVGRTPYRDNKQKPNEVVIKLVPDSFTTPLAPYETKIRLEPGVETVVRREFGETQETSSGEIISFEKIGDGDTSLAIITIPDAAQILIDGVTRAYSPYKTTSIVPGEHSLEVSLDGYVERSFRVMAHEGYKLTAVVELSKSKEAELQPSPTPQEEAKQQIKILPTSTGFLRVRAEPSTLGEEIGKVTPGDIFEILDTDEDSGWYKIEYEEGEEGWISNQYTEKIEAESSGSPTPSSKSTLSPTKKPTPTP
jgi:hypothetical protein